MKRLLVIVLLAFATTASAQNLGDVVTNQDFRVQADHDCLWVSVYRNKVDGQPAGDTVFGNTCQGGVVTVMFKGVARGPHTIQLCAVNAEGNEQCSASANIVAKDPNPTAPKNLRLSLIASRLEIRVDENGVVQDTKLIGVVVDPLDQMVVGNNDVVTGSIDAVTIASVKIKR